jgi:hypothetical protein
MSDTIKLLEELTIEAAERLRSLTLERDRLREEVRALRERLGSPMAGGRSGVGRGEAEALATRHARARDVLAEALSDLHGDGSAT